jgi:hypothetical protein
MHKQKKTLSARSIISLARAKLLHILGDLAADGVAMVNMLLGVIGQATRVAVRGPGDFFIEVPALNNDRIGGYFVMVGSPKLHFVGSLDREVEPDFAVFEVPTAAHLLTAPIVPATISA